MESYFDEPGAKARQEAIDAEIQSLQRARVEGGKQIIKLREERRRVARLLTAARGRQRRKQAAEPVE